MTYGLFTLDDMRHAAMHGSILPSQKSTSLSCLRPSYRLMKLGSESNEWELVLGIGSEQRFVQLEHISEELEQP